jgi:hypothetical protein
VCWHILAALGKVLKGRDKVWYKLAFIRRPCYVNSFLLAAKPGLARLADKDIISLAKMGILASFFRLDTTYSKGQLF